VKSAPAAAPPIEPPPVAPSSSAAPDHGSVPAASRAEPAAPQAELPTAAPAQVHPARPSPARPGPARRVQAQELVKKGDVLRSSGDVEGAIRAYLAAETVAPALPAIQKKLAVCYQQQGDTGAARERYRRYLASDPPDAAKVRLILETLQ